MSDIDQLVKELLGSRAICGRGRSATGHPVILFAPWALHRDERHFPDPLTFKPELFDPEHGQQIPKYAYLPFSGGPRICLGNAFVMFQMKINLATIPLLDVF